MVNWPIELLSISNLPVSTVNAVQHNGPEDNPEDGEGTKRGAVKCRIKRQKRWHPVSH